MQCCDSLGHAQRLYTQQLVCDCVSDSPERWRLIHDLSEQQPPQKDSLGCSCECAHTRVCAAMTMHDCKIQTRLQKKRKMERARHNGGNSPGSRCPTTIPCLLLITRYPPVRAMGALLVHHSWYMISFGLWFRIDTPSAQHPATPSLRQKPSPLFSLWDISTVGRSLSFICTFPQVDSRESELLS